MAIDRIQGLGIFVAVTLIAGSPTGKADTIEEIVVTAQKREQRLQDVGISISAFTDERIRLLRLFNSDELAAQTPGLQAASFSGDPTVMLFAIRGVGQNDFADHHEGPTAVYVDEAYVSMLGAVGFQIFDLARIEVLRGPQGTLFGRNTTGGLVHYVTAKPTDKFEALVDLTSDEQNQFRVESFLNGPLGQKANARLSFAANQNDGYLKNRIGPDVHEVDNTAARLQLQFDPTGDIAVLLKLHGAKDHKTDVGGFEQRASIPGADGLGEYLPDDVNADWFGLGSCAGCDPLGYKDADGDPWAGDFDTPGKFNRKAYGGTLNLTWSGKAFSIISVTDVLDLDKTYGEDSDGSPNPLALFESDQDTRQFTQELRIAGESEQLTWTAGFYYLDINGDYTNRFASPLFDADEHNAYTLDTRSWAVFGQIEYQLAADWRLITGLRWTEEDKTFSFEPTCIGSGCLGFFVFPGSGTVSDIGGYTQTTVGDQTKMSDGNWDGRLQLEWSKENLLIYGGVTRGHKSGGFNAPIDALLLPDQMRYDPEVLTSYEVGFKSAMSDQRFGVNGSFFYYDYDDKQAFTFSGLTTYLLNRPSEVYGTELELFAKPWENFDLVLGLSSLSATVEDVPLPSGRLADQDMAQAPELTLNGLARKAWPIGDLMLSASLNASYVSEQYFNTINHSTARADSYNLWNGRVDLSGAGDRWNVGLFVNNIFDEHAATYAIDVSSFGYSLLSYAPPRWYGAQVRYHWN